MYLRKQGFDIIYIDETAIDERLIPIHGYAPKNKKFAIEGSPRTNRLSLLVAIHETGLVGF